MEKAVEEENMPWLNLSGLPKRNNAIKKEYNIWTVPNIILLDEEGKILLNTINDLPLIIQTIDKKNYTSNSEGVVTFTKKNLLVLFFILPQSFLFV